MKNKLTSLGGCWRIDVVVAGIMFRTGGAEIEATPVGTVIPIPAGKGGGIPTRIGIIPPVK